MKQLDPRAVQLFFFNYLITYFFLFVFMFLPITMMTTLAFLDTKEGDDFTTALITWVLIAFGIIMLFIIFLYIWSRLSYRFYRYELTDHGFRKEFGVISKKYVTIPYDRIQNVDIYRGLIARMLGLSDLNIQTAGSSANVLSGEGRLPGLSKENAEKVRDKLIIRAKESKNQGL